MEKCPKCSWEGDKLYKKCRECYNFPPKEVEPSGTGVSYPIAFSRLLDSYKIAAKVIGDFRKRMCQPNFDPDNGKKAMDLTMLEVVKECEEWQAKKPKDEVSKLREVLDFFGIQILPDGSPMCKPSTLKRMQVAEAQKQGLETPQLRKAVRNLLEAGDLLEEQGFFSKKEDIERFNLALVKLRAEMLEKNESKNSNS